MLRFDFGSNRTPTTASASARPFEGDAAYMGMEIQVIDDNEKKYGPLAAVATSRAIYNIVAPKVGFQKPVGEWNQEEITADGRHIKVVLNGHTIVDANLTT